MARLLLSATAEDVLSAPGNRKVTYIVVSVTDGDGNPISGLASSDFIVKPIIVAPKGGNILNMIKAIESDFPGVYLLQVVPDRDHTWKRGVYIFAVGVHKGFDRGQTVTSVLLD